MKDYTVFKGIYTALLTPFDPSGAIHEQTLRQLVRFNIAKGVTGFYVCGSTAEAFMLSSDERKHILEIVADEAAGRVKLIAHVGAISQRQAVDLAKHAAACKADMISSIPPFYYGFSFEEIKSYYFALADSVELPVLIYHFPANSGVQLTADKVDQFLCDERFAGIKFTSNDFMMLQQIKARHPNAVAFNGYDEMFLCGLSMGADGGIGSTYNFMADKFIAMQKLFANGDLPAARRLQAQANAIIAALCRFGVMPAEKAALEMMGIPMGVCQKPMRALTDADKNALREALLANGCALA